MLKPEPKNQYVTSHMLGSAWSQQDRHMQELVPNLSKLRLDLNARCCAKSLMSKNQADADYLLIEPYSCSIFVYIANTS